MTQTLSRLAVLLLGMMILSGCVQYKAKRGVEVAWQQGSSVEGLVVGETTRKEVMDLLGPPSQVISLEDETALYYLFEKAEGEGMLLIVYNRMQIDTRYDRAIFFFDENNLLTDFSTHVHARDG